MSELLEDNDTEPVILPTYATTWSHGDGESPHVFEVGGLSPEARFANRLENRLACKYNISYSTPKGENILSDTSSPDTLVEAAKALLEVVKLYIFSGTPHRPCEEYGVEQEKSVAIGVGNQFGFLESRDVECLNRLIQDSRIGLPEVTAWFTCEQSSGQVLRFRLGKAFHPARVFHSLKAKLGLLHSTRTSDPSALIIGLDVPNQDPWTELNILSSLVTQMLLQQPHLAYVVLPLYVLVQDAVMGRDSKWKQRILWRCLETMIYSPRHAETFCFIHVGKSAIRAKVARRLTLAAQRTEIPLHIAVSVEEYLDYPDASVPENFIDVDLVSETFKDLRRQDAASHLDSLIAGQPKRLHSREHVVDILQASTCYAHYDAFLKMIQQQSTARMSAGLVRSVWDQCVSPRSDFRLIERAVEDYGPWIAITLYWILHAARPLHIEELDILLVFENNDKDDDDDVGLFSLNRASVASLPSLLPTVIEVRDGTLQLCEPSLAIDGFLVLDGFLVQIMSCHFAHIKSPRTYMGETCLLLLMDFLSEGSFKAKMMSKNAEPALKDEWGLRFELTKIRLPAPAGISSLAEYAARHWISYYRSANCVPALSDEVFSKFVNEQTVKGWLELLAQTSGLQGVTSYEDEVASLIQYTDLGGENRGKVESFRLLEFCGYVASRRSLTGLRSRLLVLGAEVGDKEFVSQLCKTQDDEPYEQDAVVRALATASWPIEQELAKNPRIADIGRKTTADVYITALQLNNTDTAKRALAVLKSDGIDTLPDGILTKAMLIACEYEDMTAASTIFDDTELAAKLGSELRDNSGSPAWNPLHVVSTKGQVAMAKSLFKLGVSIDVLTPRQRTPLMLASMHGFDQLAETLVENPVTVNWRDTAGCTPLHYASLYGFQSVAKLLVSKQADTVAYDDNMDIPLHLAVRGRHLAIASFLLQELGPMLAAQESAELGNGEGYDNEDDEDTYDRDSRESTDDSASVHTHEDDPFHGRNALGVALCEAAKQNLVNTAETLLQEGANPNIATKSGMTPLHYAARNGSAKLVRLLLEKGATMDAKERMDCTPLDLACQYAKSEAVHELLAADAGISEKDDSSNDTLLTACAAGDIGVLKVLLSRYNKELGKGLIEAAGHAQNRAAEYLLDSGCSLDVVDKYSNTALHYAAYTDNSILTQLLVLRRSPLESKDSDGSTPLRDATRCGCHGSLRVLIDAGANIEATDSEGNTPLSIGIYHEKTRAVRLLLEKGAKMTLSESWKEDKGCNNILEFALRFSTDDVSRVVIGFYGQGKGEDDVTPAKALFVILEYEVTLAQSLLELWPNVGESVNEIVSIADGTPLHMLALRGNVDQLRTFLPNAASLNTVAGNHGTLLQAAISGSVDSIEKVKLLLESGADPKIEGGFRGTVLNAAAYCQEIDIVRLLLAEDGMRDLTSITGDYGGPIEAVIRGWPSSGTSSDDAVQLLKLLRENGAPISMADRNQGTLLHLLSWVDATTMVEWLLENDVSAAAADVAGRLPMHPAIHHGSLENLKLLLIGDITLETRDSQGRNALHYATVSRIWTMSMRVVDLYREGRPETEDISGFVNALDADMWTPLHWACRQTDLDIVKYLIDQGADKCAKTKDNWTPWHVATFHGMTDESYIGLLPEPAAHERAGLPMEEARRHTASCDICNCSIYGECYHCQSKACGDFDMCFKCYNNHSLGIKLHPGFATVVNAWSFLQVIVAVSASHACDTAITLAFSLSTKARAHFEAMRTWTDAAATAAKKLPLSSSLHHHDLPSFLAHARRTGLSPTSTLYTGTRYEYICLQTLTRLSFTLTRTGGRADHGIDLVGHWHPANASSSSSSSLPSHPLRVLVQCKALRSKPAPALIRELEGIYAGAPAGWRNGDTTIAVLVAKRPATKGVREALRCSRVPVVWVMLEDLAERDGGYMEAEEQEEMGRIRQILWNAKVIGLGVEGLGVGVRYLSPPSSSSGEKRGDDGGGKVEKEVVLTWKGEPVMIDDEEEEEEEDKSSSGGL
ncbi:MAG: hypothetical protein Q9197_000252 [Variospora fuerteventurae]